jgi:methylglutaconyl-CoA hydratase
MRTATRLKVWRPLGQVRRYAAAAEASPIKLQNHPAPHSGTIRVLLLDRPDARNALSKQLVTDLRRHVDEIKAEGGTGGTRALIIASNVDKAFCAGADLKERRGMSQQE